MSNTFMKTGNTGHCSRCGRPYREADADVGRWNSIFDAGYEKGLVCPRCQTDRDHLGAEIDSIELEGTRLVDWDTLGQEDHTEVILQVIEQRVRRVIADHRAKAEMASDTHVIFDLEAWTAEAINGTTFFDGQSETVHAEARAAAASIMRQMLNLDAPNN